MKEIIDNISNFFAEIVKKIQNKIKYYKESWILYLYYQGQYVAKKRIDKDYAPMGKIYVINVKGKRHLVGTNKKVKMVVKSYKYKYSDEKKKEVHIETLLFEGVDIK